eukprot:TRINITY_DN4196_c0_g1_i4.p1 TRINITY_DN4196_c0_g1~~TRINITY_DN4196_c0_g1_i4.p1  ORF type:complete len:188 (+),score=41.66 TRINITY_DN4196_c0_g1_i4:52-615(+)
MAQDIHADADKILREYHAVCESMSATLRLEYDRQQQQITERIQARRARMKNIAKGFRMHEQRSDLSVAGDVAGDVAVACDVAVAFDRPVSPCAFEGSGECSVASRRWKELSETQQSDVLERRWMHFIDALDASGDESDAECGDIHVLNGCPQQVDLEAVVHDLHPMESDSLPVDDTIQQLTSNDSMG